MEAASSPQAEAQSIETESAVVTWTVEDDKNFISLLNTATLPTWNCLAKSFSDPLKSKLACMERYLVLERSQPDSLNMSNNTILYWSKYDDTALLQLARELETYNEIADEFIDPMKTFQKCKDRHIFLAKKIENTLQQLNKIDTAAHNNENIIAQAKNGFLFIYILFY
jgi:hypothetical protein